MSRITVKYTTEDVRLREMADLYWKMNGQKLKYDIYVADLAKQYGYRGANDMTPVIRQASYGIIQCETCQEEVTLRVRTEINLYYDDFCRTGVFECKECVKLRIPTYAPPQPKATAEQDTTLAAQAAPPSTLEDSEQLGELINIDERLRSFASHIHQQEPYAQLSEIQVTFLLYLVLYTGHDIDNRMEYARKRVGLSHDLARLAVYRLHKHGIIDLNESLFFTPAEVKALRQAMGLRGKHVRSLFFSPKEKDLYHKLRDIFAYVHLRVNLSTFIPYETVTHYFNNKKTKDYYRDCQIDCLVADKDGNPKLAFEYISTSHLEDAERLERTAFKERLLKEVGITLKKIDYKLLQKKHLGLDDLHKYAHLFVSKGV